MVFIMITLKFLRTKTMQKFAKDACEEIDAGIFSGDTFDKIDELNELNHYLDRWKREIQKRITLINNKKILQKLVWEAFNASRPVGMGIMHAGVARNKTIDTVINWDDVNIDEKGSLEYYTDYLYGRMMKTRFMVHGEGNVYVHPEIPNSEYQSWAGTFATANDLIEAAKR